MHRHKIATDGVSEIAKGKATTGQRPDKISTAPTSQLLQKSSPAEIGLPAIHLNSGPNIAEIGSQLIIFCQQKGIGQVAQCLITGEFAKKEEIEIDDALLGPTTDPHNLQRDHYSSLLKSSYDDFKAYIRSRTNCSE